MTHWPDVIQAIEARGLTRSEIARRVKCSAGQITQLAQGDRREPRHGLGDALLRLRDGFTTVNPSAPTVPSVPMEQHMSRRLEVPGVETLPADDDADTGADPVLARAHAASSLGLTLDQLDAALHLRERMKVDTVADVPEALQRIAKPAVAEPVKREVAMSYAEAEAAYKAGTLQHSVFTERGWYCPATAAQG